MTSELDGKLHMYFAVFGNEELLRKYVAIVSSLSLYPRHAYLVTSADSGEATAALVHFLWITTVHY